MFGIQLLKQKIDIQNESKEKYDEVTLWWKKEGPFPADFSQKEDTTTSIRFPKTEFMMAFVSPHWANLRVAHLRVTRLAGQLHSLDIQLYTMILLCSCFSVLIQINSGELHCLSEKSSSHISLSTCTKALGGLFYGYRSGKLNAIFFCFLALGD